MSVFTWNDRTDEVASGNKDQIITGLVSANAGARCAECGKHIKNGDRAMYWHFTGRDIWLALHADCAGRVARGVVLDFTACLPVARGASA